MIDLDAYLARIRLKAAPAPDAEGLAALQRAHRLAIPFENLAIRLGRGIAIDSASVFAKLVTAKRGGYCFEHNRLFADALAALGYAVRPLLARVWLTASEPPPLTHTLLLVSIDGTEWIADAGFGGSYCPPLPLAAGAEAVAPDGARFRLRADAARGWMVERDGDPATTDGRGNGRPGFQPQFSFTTATVEQADLEMANHWTSTRPGTRFLDLAVVSIALPAGFASLTDRAYRRRTPSDDVAATIDDPRAYRLRLSMMFGIDLSAEEVAALGLF